MTIQQAINYKQHQTYPISGHLSNQRLVYFLGDGQKKWVYPPLFQTKVGGGKMQTSSPPVITPNRSQSNPDHMITLPRPIQSVGMDLHDVSGTSTGQTLPRERRAPPGTHFCPTIWWVYPHSATIFILHPLLSTFSSTCCCCCCCLHIKSRSGLYSVLSNIRTGPTDADAFRGHRLTTQKGYT